MNNMKVMLEALEMDSRPYGNGEALRRTFNPGAIMGGCGDSAHAVDEM